MPTPADVQILGTKVESVGPGVARVELTVADAATVEEASESVSISVRIAVESEAQPFAEYQRLALHRAVVILREHSRPLDDLMQRLS